MKKIITLLFVFLFLFQISPVLATSSGWGLDDVVNRPDLQGAFNVEDVREGADSYLTSRIGIVIGAILSFIGVIFMVLIVYAGFSWMTARGNDQQVEKAKNLIFRAIIGLIIVLAAYAITTFVGGVFSS
ncbi:MAG: hypothetical protein WCZ12_01605 [Patescibacteria group bacterium]